jgi:hypothetical protein
LRNGFLFVAGALVFATCACADPDAELKQEFRAASLALAGQVDPDSKTAVEARDGWILHSREVHYLSVESASGDLVPQTKGKTQSKFSDPVSVIVDFRNQLERRGIELYFVPVPERPVIYPESIIGPEPFAGREVVPNLHSFLQEMLAILQERGVRVIDLTELFLSQREGPDGREVYARSETHWTPHGIALAAGVMAAEITEKPWFGTIEKHDFHQEWMLGEHSGSTYKSYKKMTGISLKPDKVWIRKVRLEADDGRKGIGLNNPESPVIVMGDSNTMFWDHLDSALPQHLAYELGFPVDVFASKGGGANVSRLNLVRKIRSEPEYLEGKRVVIWCLSARTFTNTRRGWISIAMD